MKGETRAVCFSHPQPAWLDCSNETEEVPGEAHSWEVSELGGTGSFQKQGELMAMKAKDWPGKKIQNMVTNLVNETEH